MKFDTFEVLENLTHKIRYVYRNIVFGRTCILQILPKLGWKKHKGMIKFTKKKKKKKLKDY